MERINSLSDIWRSDLSGGMPNSIVTRCQNERKKKMFGHFAFELRCQNLWWWISWRVCVKQIFWSMLTLWSTFFFFFSLRIRQVLAFSFASVHTNSQLTTYKRQTLCAHSQIQASSALCFSKKIKFFSIFVNYIPDWMCAASLLVPHTHARTPPICCW